MSAGRWIALLLMFLELGNPLQVHAIGWVRIVVADFEEHKLFNEAGIDPNLLSSRSEHRLCLGDINVLGPHQICGNDGGGTTEPLTAVHKHDLPFMEGLVDELACCGQMDKEVGVVSVLDGDAHVTYARLGGLGGYFIGANGENSSDLLLGEGPRGSGRLEIAQIELALENGTDVPPAH